MFLHHRQARKDIDREHRILRVESFREEDSNPPYILSGWVFICRGLGKGM